jgi:hypothetical protein
MQRLRIPALLLFGMLGGCKAPGATLTRLLSINDSGQIVGGTGAHGFLATPIPEPSSLPLLVACLIGLTVVLQRNLK